MVALVPLTPPAQPFCTSVMVGSPGSLAHTQRVASDPENWSPTQ